MADMYPEGKHPHSSSSLNSGLIYPSNRSWRRLVPTPSYLDPPKLRLRGGRSSSTMDMEREVRFHLFASYARLVQQERMGYIV